MTISPGPTAFARALRTAISDSELTLAELADRLAAHGHRVSRSSLSAWQSGRSAPVRREARAALPRLEQLLDLETGTLTGAVVRTPAAEHALLQPEVRPPWSRSSAARQLLAQLDARAEDPTRPERLSVRMRVHVDEQGRQEAMHFSTLIRGGAETAERLVPLVRLEPLPALPTIPLLYGATLGRMRARASAGLVAIELLLDEPLPPGEETLVEYLLPLPAPRATQWTRTEVGPGVRELTLQAVFGRSPAEVRVTTQTGTDGTPRSRVLAGADDSYQCVLLDPEPGGYGLEWSWPT